jgi:hypothetical protein
LLIPTTVAVLSATAYEPPANYLQDRPPADEPVAEPPGAPAMPAPAAPTLTPGGTEVTPPAAAPPPATPPATEPPAPTTPPSPPPSGAVPHKRTLARLPPYHFSPPALIAFTPEALSLNVPAIAVGGRYTREELAIYGVTQATEVRVPVLDFVF